MRPWVHGGYRYTKSKQGGKELVFDEVLSPIIKEALEGYASGYFETQAEVKRYLNSQPAFPKPKKGEVTQQRVTQMLTQPLYAGYLNHKRWAINWVRANHIISLDTFEKIQQRRKATAKAPARKNLNIDFPMRGFVLCDDCQKPLTACWSAGKRKKYPYYLCDTKNCESYRKSIRRDKIEGEFDEIIRCLQPTKDLIALAKTMFKNAWNQRAEQAQARVVMLKQETRAIGKQIDELLERVLQASNATVICAYEGKIETLERRRSVMIEKLEQNTVPDRRFDEFIEHAMQFLANPWNLWSCGHYHMQQLVLRLAFSEAYSIPPKPRLSNTKNLLTFQGVREFS